MPQAQIPDISEIQNFDTSDFTGFINGGKDVDWVNGLLYLGGAQNAEVKSCNLATWDTHDAVQASAGLYNDLIVVGEDGNLYTQHGAGPNCGRINKIDPSALATVVDFFGDAAGGFQFDTDATHWHVSYDVDSIVSHSVHYLVSTAFQPSQTNNQVSVLNLDTMAWAPPNFNTDEGRPSVTRGLDHAGDGCAYIIGMANPSIELNLYRVSVDALGVPTMVKLFTKAPHDVDASLTHFESPQGCVLDETDGNIIFRFPINGIAAWNVGVTYAAGAYSSKSGHDYRSLIAGNIGHDPTSSPTQWEDRGASSAVQAWIAKINITTGDIMWAVAVGSLPSSLGRMNSSLIQYGLYGYISPAVPRVATFIRTLTGQVITNANLNNFFADNQFWRDLDGSWIGQVQWAHLGLPDPHGTTPSSFNGWGVLFPGAGAPVTVINKQVQVFG
jgi:hypothetical protein